MNTRNAYALRARRQAAQAQPTAAAAMPARPRDAGWAVDAGRSSDLAPGRHPLTDRGMNARLAVCEESVKGRFDAIVPTLKEIAGLSQGEDYVVRAQALARDRLGFELPARYLEDAWVAGADFKSLYADGVFAALDAAGRQFAEDLARQVEVVQDTANFFIDCGFHAVDISPCADGRLKGLLRYILRLPLSSFSRRKAYAGALFDVETDVRHWVGTELRRYREGVPTTVDSGTRYLKIAVYHTSSSDPNHEGCAAHGSNEHKAIQAALERLLQFREAIENAFCCGASTDILLIGVDTDNDAIRVHIPDGEGDLSAHRFVDNARLYQETLNLTENDARLAVYESIRKASATGGWGSGHGEPHDGMRRLIANLLINNLSQIDYVNELYGGRYPDLGHAERFISVGDGFEEVQVRNLAFYAHLHTVEEGAVDLDVGIKIFSKLNVQHGLPVPVAIHYRYDARVPGSRERTEAKARRVKGAIEARYPQLMAEGMLRCHMSVQDLPTGSPVEEVKTA